MSEFQQPEQINSPHYQKIQHEIAEWRTCNNDKLPVVEIFHSIEGEGIKAGLPATFVRFVGCNLRCTYCDTKYSYNPDKNTLWMDPSDIMSEILKYGCKNVTFTGGEPLLYQFDIYKIAKRLLDYKFNIETNGSMEPTEALWKLSNLIFTADCKCPSSGAPPLKYAKKLRPMDALKFVVGTEEDLDFVKKFLLDNEIWTKNIFIHPVFDQIDLRDIAEFVKKNEDLNIRMGIQMHKIIYPPEMRGV